MTVSRETRATRRSELHCRRNRQVFPRLRETRKRPDAPGTDEAWVLVRRRENGRSRSDASRVTGYGKPQGESATGRWPRRVPFDVLTHSAATPRRERCASHAALSNHVSKHGEEASDELVDRDTTEGVPIVALSHRKARQGGGLGRAGQREAFVARRASRQLPPGPGTGEAVPAMTTKDVRDR